MLHPTLLHLANTHLPRLVEDLQLYRGWESVAYQQGVKCCDSSSSLKDIRDIL